MINIDLHRIYLNNVEKSDLYCLTYLNTKILGMPTTIYKTFKTFTELKDFCENNSSDLELFVCNISPEEVEHLQKGVEFDYSNIN